MGRRAEGSGVDEAAPYVTVFVAKDDAVAIRHTGNGAAIGIAKEVAYGVVGVTFGLAAPDVAILIAEANQIALSVAMENRVGSGIFKLKVAAWDTLPGATPAIDHTEHYGTKRLWEASAECLRTGTEEA